MMSLWDALRMNMMISYQELVRTFPYPKWRSVAICCNKIFDIFRAISSQRVNDVSIA